MGSGKAVQHLAALRHEKIAFITGPLTLKSARAREEAFVQSMNEIGMQPESRLIVEGDHTLEGGQEAFTKLWALKARPTAILCSKQLGRLAFQALLSDVRREAPNPKGTEYVLKTSFVLRDSTALNSQKRLS